MKMLTNIANDLDLLLTDLVHMHPCQVPGEGEEGVGLPGMGEHTLNTLTQHSGDTLGKDSFLSSAEAASRRLGDTTGSSQSLVSSSSDNLSADSGHDERTQGTTSPLVFDPAHFGSKPKNLDTTTTATMTTPMLIAAHGNSSHDNESHSGSDLRPISLVERLAKTHSIWLLTQMSRAGAVHLLKDRETGVFLIRKSSQSMSLALSVQNRLTDRANVDHYLIEASDYGMRLQGSAHFFHSIPSLISHYIENLDELPYRLTLTPAILQARSSRELASLAMLGQDFWLSPVSRKARTPSPACGSLHKSCSEPIDIRQPMQHSTSRPHTPTTPPLHALPPSHSVSDFSDFLTTQQVQEEQAQIFKGQFSNQVDLPPPSHCSPHLPPLRVFASVPTGTSCAKGQGGFGPHLLRLKGYNDTPTSTESSGEESGGGHVGVPHIHLVGASPQSMCAMSNASSQTDFSSLNRHKPKGKPNLYSMTPVELLHLPENNSYFHSNLSDKMSDYEDIWRSSYYDSDSVRNGSVRGGGGGGGGGGYEVGSCTTAQSDFSKFFAVSGNRESTGVRPVPVVVTTNCNTVATQSEESPPIPPKNWRTSTVVNPKHLHPLGRLSRLKSSSDSSLATVSSPVYAEPADAVVFRERQNRSSRAKVRRRSAPSVSSQSIPPEHLPPHTSRQSPFSGAEKLATILSQAALDQAENTHPKKDTLLPKKGRKVDPKQRSGAGMTRSQSMRTAQEVTRLAKNKPAWHERFNRLKLGTKVLSRSGSPYAATTKGAQPQLDDSLFLVEESSSGPTAVNRFPVYQRSKLVQSVNRGSYFSESSTVQDIISCAMPELMVRPIQAQRLVVPAAKTLSEYDNYNPYAPPSASSRGTIFCKPWEGSVVDTLLRTSHTTLPPAMDLQERVQMWQEANQTFHHSQQSQQQRENPTHQQQLQQHQQHLQQLQMIQQQQRLQQSVVKQAHTVQTVTTVGNAGTVNSTTNVNVSKSSSRMVVQSEVTQTSQTGVHPQGHPQPQGHPHLQGHANLQGHPHPQGHPHKSVSPTHPQQARPQSMMVQERHHQHPQLHRSHSNPNQAQQLPLPRNQQGQGHQQGQGRQQHQGHHHQLGHHLHQQGHHLHQQGQPVVTEGSSVTPDSRMGGLSSNCPDVINCHHIAVDTGNAALSDDEILIQSVTSTLPNRGQLAAQRKQAARDPGSKIREYIYKLSQDRNTTFGSTIENFIQCTVESQEKTPHHVMRNVRQFMTGIKNYLVKHGEGQLEDLIERERNKLGRNEILNIDALIETTLHMCVLRPLKHHIYRLFVDYHGRNNSLELMSRNIKYARTKTAEEIGIKPGLIPPQAGDMETIKHYLDKMQRAYSPLKKLENLLCATSAIYSCVKVQGKQHLHSRGPASLGADDFLPLLIYVLVHCGLVSAEIEADYMWGLLHPSVLTGEGGYYLTTLSSAVLILKNFQEAHESKTASLEGQLPTLGEVQGFLKIAFPDELRDTILWKTLPVRPNMTTKDVCSMIAHKFKITNPQDYGLILLSNGEESQLSDNQCPQILKKDNTAAGKESFFAYKRLGANIAWPSSMKHS
ncbi:protein sprint-like isoform X2 [Littorina saxatilis]|uniref:protein sprint-like isoform X2 n=1 Tax=Littorina saxatilis TaxID=31220 RepID=UPI0038B68A90